MPKYYVTFGAQYAEEEHPHFSCHPDGWIEIEAPSEHDARIEAHNCFGDKWAFLYTEKNFNPSMYPAGRLATIEEVKEHDKDENKLYYKKNESAIKIPMVITSETEKQNTLTPEQLMIMNNIANLISNHTMFPRVDKYNKRTDE